MSEPVYMVHPIFLQLVPLPNVLTYADGSSAMGDLNQEQGAKAGYLIPQPIPALTDGFVRTFASPPWRNAGDGTAAPAYTDILQADYDAQQAALAAAAAEASAQSAAAAQASYTAAVAMVTPLAQQYRALLREYFGAGAETSQTVTQASVLGYFLQLDAAKTITAQQSGDALTLQTIFAVIEPLANDGVTPAPNTWSASFWQMIPQQ